MNGLKPIRDHLPLYSDVIDLLYKQFQQLKVVAFEINQFLHYSLEGENEKRKLSPESETARHAVNDHREQYSHYISPEKDLKEILNALFEFAKSNQTFPKEFMSVVTQLRHLGPMASVLFEVREKQPEKQIANPPSLVPQDPNSLLASEERKKALLLEKKKRKKQRRKINKMNIKVNENPRLLEDNDEKEASETNAIYSLNDSEFDQVLSNFKNRLNSQKMLENPKKSVPIFHSELISICESFFKNLENK